VSVRFESSRACVSAPRHESYQRSKNRIRMRGGPAARPGECALQSAIQEVGHRYALHGLAYDRCIEPALREAAAGRIVDAGAGDALAEFRRCSAPRRSDAGTGQNAPRDHRRLKTTSPAPVCGPISPRPYPYHSPSPGRAGRRQPARPLWQSFLIDPLRQTGLWGTEGRKPPRLGVPTRGLGGDQSHRSACGDQGDHESRAHSTPLPRQR
jgi:hypothetical protein